jgi:ABC-type transporter Mla maintaining outer membrane lipid asymmetry permease subunit MlaE
MRNSFIHYLERVGHLWVENSITLLQFGGRMIRAFVLVVYNLGSRGGSLHLGRYIKQAIKVSTRGIVVALALGIASGVGVGGISGKLADEFRPAFETLVLPVILRDILPLFIALLTIARSGSAVATKIAIYPATQGKKSLRYDDTDIEKAIFPQFLSMTIAAGLLYIILAFALLTGYLSGGAFSALRFVEVREFIRLADIGPVLLHATARSMIFGAIVAYVASAFGVQAAERFLSDARETHDLHYAVWESSVTSLVICSALTFSFMGG